MTKTTQFSACTQHNPYRDHTVRRMLTHSLWMFLVVAFAGQVQADTYYFHNDHLGTPQVLTDENQAVVWKGEYDPFGKATETVALVEQNLRFPGQYVDRETGLHYNYFRDYDPSTGRYAQSDPIGLNGGINTYSYVSGNPIRYIDIFGLEKLILVSEGFFTMDRVLYVNAERFPDKEGTLHIIAHGTPEWIGDDRRGRVRRDRLYPDDLARLLRNGDIWKEGVPIEIWGCSTAGGGDTSFAATLANLLGVPVKGFENNISVYDLNRRHAASMIKYLPTQP